MRKRGRRAFEGRRQQDGARFQSDGEHVDGLKLHRLLDRKDGCRCGRLVMDGAAGGHRLVRGGVGGAVGGRSLHVTAHRHAGRRTEEHRHKAENRGEAVNGLLHSIPALITV